MLAPPVLRILAKVVYWLVVLAVSLVLLVLLVRFFEARDESQVDGAVLLLGPLLRCATGASRP